MVQRPPRFERVTDCDIVYLDIGPGPLGQTSAFRRLPQFAGHAGTVLTVVSTVVLFAMEI